MSIDWVGECVFWCYDHFFSPGLIILTVVVGGISALGGAKFGREIGELLYDQISTYEEAMPSARKKHLLSENALSVL